MKKGGSDMLDVITTEEDVKYNIYVLCTLTRLYGCGRVHFGVDYNDPLFFDPTLLVPRH